MCLCAYVCTYLCFVWILDRKTETEVWGLLPLICLNHNGCCILLCAWTLQEICMCPQSVFMWFIWCWQGNAVCFLCDALTEGWSIIYTNFVLFRVKQLLVQAREPQILQLLYHFLIWSLITKTHVRVYGLKWMYITLIKVVGIEPSNRSNGGRTC